jgi:hypothetical protein
VVFKGSTIGGSDSALPKKTRSRSLWRKTMLKHRHTLRAPGVLPIRIQARLDVTTQHTFSWESTLMPEPKPGRVTLPQPADELPKGSCNLYLFPNVTLADTGRNVRLSGAQLQLLSELIVALARDKDCTMWDQTDEVGAYMIHALVVGNTFESLSLSERVLEAAPHLLQQVHMNHRSGIPLFTGESVLHIAAVNQQQVRRIVPCFVRYFFAIQFSSHATGVRFSRNRRCSAA